MMPVRSILLLVLSLPWLLAADVLHHGHDWAGGDGTEALVQHTCDGVERHIPLGDRHPCTICLLAHQRLSSPVESVMTGAEHLPFLVQPPVSTPNLLFRSALQFPAKRGPPSA